jgi:hypothetical protein
LHFDEVTSFCSVGISKLLLSIRRLKQRHRKDFVLRYQLKLHSNCTQTLLFLLSLSMLIFWVVMLYELVCRYRCFGGTYSLHLQNSVCSSRHTTLIPTTPTLTLDRTVHNISRFRGSSVVTWIMFL